MPGNRAMTAPRGWGRDGGTLGLICGGHFFSHFYMLVLPPLFPILKAEFGVSYTALGGILAAFSLASGGAQYPMGVLVDRLGARYLLICGLALMSVSLGLMSLTGSYEALLILAFLGGLGNSIFHPADYTIMGATIAPDRLGRAYGIHTFSGMMGWVAAPPAMIFLVSLTDWRSALGIVALFGFAAALLLFVRRGLLEGGGRAAEAAALEQPAPPEGADRSRPAVPAPGRALLLSVPILLMFLFFVTQAGVQIGVQSFTPTALGELFGTPLVSANAALTGYLMGGAGGVLLGGVIADRFGRMELVTTVGYTASGAALCVVAFVALPVPLLIAVFVFAGLMLGIIAPSRDLLVRAIAPKGASGRVFGFVSTGLDVGGGLVPLLFGWILDQGAPAVMFVAAAAMMMVSLAAGLAAARYRRPAASTAAAE